MARIEWDKTGEKLYETGVDRGVFYKLDPKTNKYTNGVAWNGLTGVTESPSGAEANKNYADNILYLNLMSAEELGATIEAYTFPREFGECDGSKDIHEGVSIGQQNRATFGFTYRTVQGNDVLNNDYGYKIHCLYGCKASPSERAYTTINDSPEAITFSWELTTTPISVPDHKPTANVTIDSTKLTAAQLKALEDVLYGTESEEARLPEPAEIVQIIQGAGGGDTLSE